MSRRPLPVAGAFVLLTDGVVEGPSFPIEAGLERVTEVVRAGVLAGACADPGALATEVIKVADLTGHTDDAAVLVLCHDAAPADGPARPGAGGTGGTGGTGGVGDG